MFQKRSWRKGVISTASLLRSTRLWPGVTAACALWRNRSGAVAVYLGIASAVLIGAGGLWIDLGRLYTVSTELQSAADAAALAGAAELDGAGDAIARATNAAQTLPLVSNKQTFGIGTFQVNPEDLVLRFLRDLPPDDQTIPSSYVTTDPAEARFIEVTIDTRSVRNFLIPVLGGPGTSTAGVVAIAGFTRVMCRIPPLFICNPDEVVGGEPFDVEFWKGKQVIAKHGGSGAGWQPGSFGLLDAQGGQSAPAIAALLAAEDPNTPCVGAFVDVKPGSTVSTHTALNTRFDMFETPHANSFKNQPGFNPAKVVTKGKVTGANSCDFVDASPPVAAKLPRDSAFRDGRFGNGTWSNTQYCDINHPTGSGRNATCKSFSGARHELYEWEHNNNYVPNNAPGGENGGVQCASSASGDVERRFLHLAVVNCKAVNFTGNSVPDIPVLDVVKVFLTEPVEPPPDITTIMEFVGSAGANSDEVLHEYVQLYR